MTLLELLEEQHTAALGEALAASLKRLDEGAAIALCGELGAGKTTLARAIIKALGHAGPVVSPSYTLVEPYEFEGRRLLHLDLYRIADPEELEYLGWREWDSERDWMLVEWPEKGVGFLPKFDLRITIQYAHQGRRAELRPSGQRGEQLLDLTRKNWGQDSADF